MSHRLICAALLGGLMIVGCEKKEDAPAVPAADSAAKSAADSAKSATDDAVDAAKSAASDAADAAKKASATTQPTAAAPAAPAAAAPAAPVAPAAAPAAPAAAPAAADATAGASAEAQKLLDQAMTYIKENKLDLADKSITQLEGMKSTLSPTMQSAVDNARKALSAAKATGGGLTAPAVPK